MNGLTKKIKKKIKTLLEKMLEYVKDVDDYAKLSDAVVEKTNSQIQSLDTFCLILEKKRDSARDIIKKWSNELKIEIKRDKSQAKIILKKIHQMRARRDGLDSKINNIIQIALSIKDAMEMKEYHDILLRSTNVLTSQTNKIDLDQLDNNIIDTQESIKEIERFSNITNENLNVLTDDSELEKELENLESQILDEQFVEKLLNEPIKSTNTSSNQKKEKEKEKEKRIVTIQNNEPKSKIEIKVGEHNKKLDDFNEIFTNNEIVIEKKNKILN
jgi:hypothetical protein